MNNVDLPQSWGITVMEKPEASPWLGLLGGLFVFLSLAFSPQVLAQEEDDAIDEAAPEEIIVTGSRLKRDTYSSIAPLQVISGQISREIGSIDPAGILQDSTVSAGNQIDITYQGFVLDNGPGSSTINLRGLGASRTLVLINSRRAAPVGVEGAPFAPDLNIIPSTLVQSYEILLDGASSVYGSDALAGVANIILRKDFDGLEIEAYSTIPEYSNGVENTISAAWGMNGDRGFFGVAVDYADAEAVDRNDRPWSAGCESYREITTDGEIRTEFIGYQNDYNMNTSPCQIGFGARRIFDNDLSFGSFGSLYYTPNETNTGVPNFSEATLFDVALDSNGDGIPDVDFTDYFVTNDSGVQHLFPERERISFMAYGEYTFAGDMNITPYFEALYNKRKTFAQSRPGGALAVEPVNIPGTNPYNPCNPNGLDGVDCQGAFNNVITDPAYILAFQRRYESTCADFGFTFAQCTPPLFGIFPIPETGARAIEAQVSVNGDRDKVWSEVDQLRIVGGVKGDLPFLTFGSLDNWGFDVAVVYSDGTGTSLRQGIREDLLRYSVDTSRVDATGSVVCGDATGGPCVPVNMFAPSLYQDLTRNDFATQAERDFLFDDRTFDTTYTQSYITAILTGDLFSMPAGDVAIALGYEYRNDEIDSIPNDVARDGLLIGFFKDLGAVGEKDTEEWFAEVEVPLLANRPAFKELTVNVSTRHTDDEFYGGAWTYSGKLAWRPIDSLLLRGTVGTSYRAPNLRENFLQGQSGFRNLFDPCVTPDGALVPDIGGGFVYDPNLDTRSQVVLDNCVLDGVDPTDLGISASGNSFPIYSVEVLTGVGQQDLREEKSDSWTAGFSWDQPFFEAFNLTLGATYYEVEIRDEIIELFSQFSINVCYDDPELNSPFCNNITRNLAGGGLIFGVDEAFLNRDVLTSRGIDFNLAIDWPTQMFGRAVDFSADFNFNRKLEFSTLFVDIETGDTSADSNVGEFGFPEWEGQGILRVDISDFRLTWSTRYLAPVNQDPDRRERFDFGNWNEFGDLTNFTCLGEAAGDVDCRPVGEADSYFRHDISFYYYGDMWTFGVGIRNLTNEAPPLVDDRAVPASAFNVPLGAGYDMNGRQYFFNVAVLFDDLTL